MTEPDCYTWDDELRSRTEMFERISAAEAENEHLRVELNVERKRSRELREREAIAHDQLATALGCASSMVWPDLIRHVADMAARSARADGHESRRP